MGVFGDNRDVTVVRAGKALVTVNEKKMIALGVQVVFQRAVELLPTIGEKRVISIGEGQGEFSADTILSKDNDIEAAFRLNEDGCVPFPISITFMDTACSENGKSVDLHHCVASAVSIGMQGGRGYIAEGLKATFTGLDLPNSGGNQSGVSQSDA